MKKFAIVLFAVFAAFIVACGSSSPSEKDAQRLDDHAATPATSSNAAKPKSNTFGDGDYEVGKTANYDAGTITAGTYVVTSLENGTNCYWARLKNFDGDLNAIIANDNIDPGSTARVTVKSSDAGFKLSGDCLAKKK